MPCQSPLLGYKNPDGSTSYGTRKKSLGRFGLRQFRCGMCLDCRLYRAREWAIRMSHEASEREHNCFITLTFAKDPVSISKRDLQLFFKKLRNITGADLRYAAVGEYGDKLSRPHYHACIFGYDFPDKYYWKKSERGNIEYRSPTLEKAWPHGHCTIGPFSEQTAGYTARYIMKKQTGENAELHYQRDFNGCVVNVTPEFILTSRRPALGMRWIEKYWRDVFGHNRDQVIFQGKQCPPPYYYVRWLMKHQPEHYEMYRSRNIERAKEKGLPTATNLAEGRRKSEVTKIKTKRLKRNYENTRDA